MCNPGLLCSIDEAINTCIEDLNWIYTKLLNRTVLKKGMQKKFLLFLPTRILIQKNHVIAALFRKEEQFRIITIELHDRVTGHGVFYYVLLSPNTLNRIL